MSYYKSNLFRALRMAVYVPSTQIPDNQMIAKAVTLNENLITLGYILPPNHLLQIAASPSLDTLYEEIHAFIPDITAKPMYPDFPSTVMSMDEAQFRLHQLCHYFSTYGFEYLLGEEIKSGWLPDTPDTEKTGSDTRLLSSSVLELISESDMYEVPLRRILGKRERMTKLEGEIVKEACRHIDTACFTSLRVEFKENMKELFLSAAEGMTHEQALFCLHALCNHTGDVLRFTEQYLNYHHFRLKTAEKKLFVKLLESYPAADFSENVIHSVKNGKRNLTVLRHLNFGRYSRNKAHLAVYSKLADGELISWENQARTMLSNHDDNAISFVAKRPGMMLRMAAWMIRLGYRAEDIQAQLLPHADRLSMQTILSILNHFKKNQNQDSSCPDEAATEAIVYALLEKRLRLINTGLRGKKVYLDASGFNLKTTEANPASKSLESSYIPNIVSYKIPDSANTIRAFVYWNDSRRVDVDLHASAIDMFNEIISVGWNGEFLDHSIVFSGDITHSDAAEYIDINLNESTVKYAMISINVFDIAGTTALFSNIETCFAGLMAVDKLDADVKLYEPANCFFTHNLTMPYKHCLYGYIDVVNRTLNFIGEECTDFSYLHDYLTSSNTYASFSVQDYLELLIKQQDMQLVDCREDADVIFVMEKASAENEISLIDCNFFYDAPAAP